LPGMGRHRCPLVWNSRNKHLTHVGCFTLFVVSFELLTGAVRLGQDAVDQSLTFDPLVRYGCALCVFLYLLRFISLLVLPQCVFNVCGLVFFNAFKDHVRLNNSPLLAPFICFRVVTKGDYRKLIVQNVAKNIDTCLRVGLEHFVVEVVTDKSLNLDRNCRVRELVVPAGYRTKSGALFKARALQYCWEEEVNMLRDDDWIVHLDEETLLTENSVRGILNFCSDGQHPFGQGLITYANGKIVNWVTTLADSFRVADDMVFYEISQDYKSKCTVFLHVLVARKLRFQFRCFHRPLFGWKGSFVVTKAGAEKKVSFDHGSRGSIAEDCYFGMVAYRDGYKFEFIEGEMLEKSPFTFWDFLQQRKRWLQGICLVVHSAELPWRCKIFLAMSFYAWATMPLSLMNFFFAYIMPLPSQPLFDFCVAFVGAVNLYMYIFGVWKSFASRYCRHPFVLLYYTVAAICVIPFNVFIEIVAVLWGLFGRKNQFYVVNKDPVVVHTL
ncbi:Beta-1,4-mannosyltransferase bre-3, partial [Trichinella patagoniensis]